MKTRKEEKADSNLSLWKSLSGTLTSRPARVIYVVAGTAGLIALTVALVGPKRIERTVYRPLRDAVEPRAEKLWAEAAPVREQIAVLLENVSPSRRARLVSSFQSWIGRFTAN
jgi:hypothetical protein